MFKKSVLILFTLIGILLYPFPDNYALDNPHNQYKTINCGDCHITNPPAIWWTNQGGEENGKQGVCRSCHNPTGMGPYVQTHSSTVVSSTKYGTWDNSCTACHNPHVQRQFRVWKGESYVYSGTSTAVTATTLRRAGANWGENQWSGYILVPDIRYPNIHYRILGNDGTTIEIDTGTAGIDRINLTYIRAGQTFGIAYGMLVKEVIDGRTVKFFRNEGPQPNSFSDGNGIYDGVCEVCHTKPSHFRNDGSGPDQLHGNVGGAAGTNCMKACHTHDKGFGHGGGTGCGTSTNCHATQGSHSIHTRSIANGGTLGLSCSECHDINNFPRFWDGAQSKAATTVCNNCHSADGAVNAKTYWDPAGSWIAAKGQKGFCGSCHDSTPGKVQTNRVAGSETANVVGNGTVGNDYNDSTYGYYATGHGKTSGIYSRLSWQDTAAGGNPAANRPCDGCHVLSSSHYNNPGQRLKAGYENNQNNDNCNQCHKTSGAATADPQWYTTYAAFTSSAHYQNAGATGANMCSECHDVHGAAGNYAGMTKGDRQDLCNQCHSGSGGHPGVGSTSFAIDGKTYTLQCISCHNVHLVTGKYSEADQNKSPLTRFAHTIQNLPRLWGDKAGEKMNDYAGSGTYRTPKDELFTGAQLPDYPTFCLDCHGAPSYWEATIGPINHQTSEPSPYFGLTWGAGGEYTGDAHGKASANQPNGYGTCPNWFACGKAFGWDNDDCVAADKNDCWPVIPRGAGDQLFSREEYTHTDRVAGANFTLSCTDCHTGHGAAGSRLGRSNVNGGSFSGTWNTMCNNCHYYYSDWHAGMSCGNASCHEQSSPHRAKKMQGDGGTRTFNPGLVLNFKFENNLKDSGTWQMDGKWYSTAGSFAAGKSGLAAVLGEDMTVQVGTENANWSTDEGYHGTWKYTEMKYNTTLEAWVYPTDIAKSEYTIFNKHVGVGTNGSYAFTLRKVNGTLRATLTMAADNNGSAQDGRAGVRGAYSSTAVPLNKWTHVAATFDTAGPDRNPADPSVGRIRIYVNGEDVTTSDASGNWMQPGTNETAMYAFSENSGWNEAGVCYNDSWCASEFSVGGFDWQADNFIGRIDEAKVWNLTKDAAYFAAYDSQAGPYISSVEGLIGSNQLTVRFSEGVYTNTGSSGALVPADFVLTDTGGNNPRTITGVMHTGGSSTAVITMSAPLVVADVNADTLAAAANAIYDNNDLGAGTEAVIIGLSSQCPTAPVSIQLNDPSGSAYIMDTQNVLYGTVYGGASTLTGSGYSGGGDGSGRYIMFDYNTACLQAATAMTIEARIKPAGIPNDTTTNYVRRILARDGSGNFQLSVWRNNAWNNPSTDTYNAPAGEASIALWVYVIDAHGGNSWKPVLTNYTGAKNGSENDCPIVSDHWYQVSAVWDTNKSGGTPGQFFQPADIYVDDQGTDGAGAGENWSGYINCTDTDQSLKYDAVKFYTADQIETYSGESFAIGANRSNPANNLFYGLIDWITWKDTADPAP